MNKKMGIVLAAVLAVIVGSVIVYSISNFSKTNEQDYVDMATQNICTLPGNVVRMDIKEKNMTTRLERQGKDWVNLDYDELEYDWLSLHAWLINFRGVVSEGIIEKVENKDLYNINDESNMITLYDEMNNAQTFKISSISNNTDSMYVSTDEINGVYKISQSDNHILQTNINDFVISKDIVPNIDQITSMEIEFKGNKKVILVKENSDQEVIWNLESYYDVPYKAQSDQVAKLLEGVLSLNDNNFEGIITDNNDYGIVSSSSKLVINDEISIRLGNVVGDKIYINLEGDDFVYSVKNAGITGLDKLKAFELVNKDILNITTSNFKEIVFKNPQGEYVLRAEAVPSEEIIDGDTEVAVSEKMTDSDTEAVASEGITNGDAEVAVSEEITDGDAEVVVSEEKIDSDAEVPVETNNQVDMASDQDNAIYNHILYLNDEQLKEEDQLELIKLINGSICLEVELKHPEIEKREDRPAESTITCTMKDGKIIKLELVPYDINYYLLRMEDTIEFAINKNKVTTLFSKLNNLIKK